MNWSYGLFYNQLIDAYIPHQCERPIAHAKYTHLQRLNRRCSPQKQEGAHGPRSGVRVRLPLRAIVHWPAAQWALHRRLGLWCVKQPCMRVSLHPSCVPSRLHNALKLDVFSIKITPLSVHKCTYIPQVLRPRLVRTCLVASGSARRLVFGPSIPSGCVRR